MSMIYKEFFAMRKNEAGRKLKIGLEFPTLSVDKIVGKGFACRQSR